MSTARSLYEEGPQYDKALENTNRRKIVKAITEAEGTARFSTIAKMSGVKDNTLLHHLNVLINYGIVKQVTPDGGSYALKYVTPAYFTRSPKIPERIAYIGLLGKKEERVEPETNVAFELLRKEGAKRIDPAFVVTSSDGADSWRSSRLKVNWILFDDDAIIDIDKIKERVETELQHLIERDPVIMDCTSFNKPGTIAIYQLAQKYRVPLIYVYESKRKLKWLISVEHIAKKFKI